MVFKEQILHLHSVVCNRRLEKEIEEIKVRGLKELKSLLPTFNCTLDFITKNKSYECQNISDSQNN